MKNDNDYRFIPPPTTGTYNALPQGCKKNQFTPQPKKKNTLIFFGRVAEGFEIKAKSVQLKLKLPVGTKLEKISNF